jgi:hypothetical protein
VAASGLTSRFLTTARCEPVNNPRYVGCSRCTWRACHVQREEARCSMGQLHVTTISWRPGRPSGSLVVDFEIQGTGGRVPDISRWASPMSSWGMVDASAMMPAHSTAGTIIACWIPSWLIRKPTKAGPIKNAA